MKKVGIISLVVFLLLSLASCTTALSPDDFQSKIEAAGYKVTNVDEQFPDLNAELSLIAAIDDNGYQIEYYSFVTKKEATKAFDEKTGFLETARDIAGIKGFKTYYDKSKLRFALWLHGYRSDSLSYLTTNDWYYVVSRVGNTLIYASTALENKDLLIISLETLGYY